MTFSTCSSPRQYPLLIRKGTFLLYFYLTNNVLHSHNYVKIFFRYIVSLLNKFEVALTWDYRTLLIPSLLPTEEDLLRSNVSIKIPVKSRGWHMRTKMITSPMVSFGQTSSDRSNNGTESVLTSRPQPDCSITRLLLMSYFPR